MKRHLDVTSDERGLCLRRRDDGGCVHLGPEGCTVHQYRPLACRVYDCRIYALGTGGQPVSVSPGHKSPAWQFEIRSERDAEIRDAYLLGAAPWMGRSEDLDTALRRIMMDFQHHVAIARALYDKIDRQRLSPAEKQQLYRAELRRLFRLAKRRSLTMADVGC
jgi:hypothetical protein